MIFAALIEKPQLKFTFDVKKHGSSLEFNPMKT
jgi:hypothetical protein